MRALVCSAVLAAATFGAGSAFAQAPEGRFDAQSFRPSAAPRDLVMVQKSEVMGDLSPVVGLFSDIALDPLVLVDKSTDQQIDAVAARLTLTAMAGIGLFDWVDLTAALPIVAWQSGGNLRRIGSEGPVEPTVLGDLRFNMRVALPYLHRKDEVKEGIGVAVAGNVNLPTGSVENFSSDGVVTGGASLIVDYRFNFGLLIAANGGIRFRPDRQFAGVRLGNMASFGVAAEGYILQRYGISVVGEVYGYPSLVSYPDDPSQVPAEVLLGIRWQSKWGLTLTVGGSFGAACSFGAPALRGWASLTFQPKSSKEQEEINRLMERDKDDPDHDGLIGDKDKCPQLPGRIENFGCPDTDTDGDGVVDKEDNCPDLAAGPRGKGGCPTAFVKGDEIVILDKVHFATDKDIILDPSKPILEDVAQVLLDHPEIRLIRIEGHTDVRASDAYNMGLSQRRVNSVMKYLVSRGVDQNRLEAKGFGHSQPLYDDAGCIGPDEDLSPTCRYLTGQNRRVVFRIVKRGAPPARSISGADQGSGILPTKEGVLPTKEGVLPNQGTLPGKGSVLPNGGVLPSQGENGALPNQPQTLPSQGVLQRSGTPKKEPDKKDPNKKDPDPAEPGKDQKAPEKKAPEKK